jgi:hypothetical protein
VTGTGYDSRAVDDVDVEPGLGFEFPSIDLQAFLEVLRQIIKHSAYPVYLADDCLDPGSWSSPRFHGGNVHIADT